MQKGSDVNQSSHDAELTEEKRKPEKRRGTASERKPKADCENFVADQMPRALNDNNKQILYKVLNIRYQAGTKFTLSHKRGTLWPNGQDIGLSWEGHGFKSSPEPCAFPPEQEYLSSLPKAAVRHRL